MQNYSIPMTRKMDLSCSNGKVKRIDVIPVLLLFLKEWRLRLFSSIVCGDESTLFMAKMYPCSILIGVGTYGIK